MSNRPEDTAPKQEQCDPENSEYLDAPDYLDKADDSTREDEDEKSRMTKEMIQKHKEDRQEQQRLVQRRTEVLNGFSTLESDPNGDTDLNTYVSALLGNLQSDNNPPRYRKTLLSIERDERDKLRTDGSTNIAKKEPRDERLCWQSSPEEIRDGRDEAAKLYAEIQKSVTADTKGNEKKGEEKKKKWLFGRKK